MQLQNFNQHISDTIYLRGKQYYESELVENAEQTNPGLWLAEIEGTDIYQVEVKLNGDEIVSWNCNCPYDRGNICKHVVALLLYIIDHRKDHPLRIEMPTDSVQVSMSELLKHIDRAEVMSFIVRYAAQHPEFRMAFEQQFHPAKQTTPSKDYRKEIKNCFKIKRSSYDRYGFSDDVDEINDNLSNYIEKAKYLIKQDCLEEAATICLEIMELIGDNVEEYMDHDETLVSVCQEAAEVLQNIIELNLSNNVLQYLQKRLGELIKNKNFENYDMADISDLLLIVTVKSSKLEDGIKLIDETLKNEPDSFRTSSLVIVKMEMLNKVGKSAEADAVTDQYLYLPEIRTIKLNRLLDNNQYQDALTLIDGGIAVSNEKRTAGTTADWKDKKLQIYLKMQDHKNIRLVAEDLFFTGRDAMKYFKLLKSIVPESQWPDYLKQTLDHTEKEKHWANHNLLPKIYIEEQDWDKLMLYVEKNTHLVRYPSINSYESYLIPVYPERLLKVYHLELLKYAEHNMGRDHYSFIAQTLNKMKKIQGGREVVRKLLTHFRTVYSKRPAMMAELRAVD